MRSDFRGGTALGFQIFPDPVQQDDQPQRGQARPLNAADVLGTVQKISQLFDAFLLAFTVLEFLLDPGNGFVGEAHKRKVGARGLMMIMEEILLESMYVLPSEKKVKDILVTKEMVERKSPVFDVIIPRIEEAA